MDANAQTFVIDGSDQGTPLVPFTNTVVNWGNGSAVPTFTETVALSVTGSVFTSSAQIETGPGGFFNLSVTYTPFGTTPVTVTGSPVSNSYASWPLSAREAIEALDGQTLTFSSTNAIGYQDINPTVEGVFRPLYGTSFTTNIRSRLTSAGTGLEYSFAFRVDNGFEVEEEFGNFDDTDATWTITSPNGIFQSTYDPAAGFDNDIEVFGTLAEVEAELNGIWTLRIEEPNGDVFEFDLEFAYDVPFAQTPTIRAPALEAGDPFTPPIAFFVEGGDATYPGSGAAVSFRLRDSTPGAPFTVFFDEVVPIAAGAWTPSMPIPSSVTRVTVTGQVTQATPAPEVWTIVGIQQTSGAPVRLEDLFFTHSFINIFSATVDVPATTLCVGDFDGDLDVDLGDFGVFGAAFGSFAGDANYEARADFDNDGDVDLGDFGVFGAEFGSTAAACAP